MIELQDFLEADFNLFISWIRSEEELIQFAGPIFIFPVTHEQLHVYNNQTVRKAYKVKLSGTGEIIGHCELNYQNRIPRLSRILIGKEENRNKGLGKIIVTKMLDKIFSDTQFDTVDLSVFDWNTNAINSYKKVGFRINAGLDTQMIVGKNTWNAVNMVINRKDYFNNITA